jgi:solute carrier family 39 (zinc transporter), member 1/2/3
LRAFLQHSIIIGLTLALSTDEFNTLFIVIIFHQAFEGLGLGSRLAFLKLPESWGWVPFTGAFLYSICTPIGMVLPALRHSTHVFHPDTALLD